MKTNKEILEPALKDNNETIADVISINVDLNEPFDIYRRFLAYTDTNIYIEENLYASTFLRALKRNP